MSDIGMSLAPCMSKGTYISNGDCSYVHSQSLSLLPRNAHNGSFIELGQFVPSSVTAISPFVEQLMRFMLKFRSADGTEANIEMALHEALANGVIHGNGENPCKAFTLLAGATWTARSQSRFETKEEDLTPAQCWIPLL